MGTNISSIHAVYFNLLLINSINLSWSFVSLMLSAIMSAVVSDKTQSSFSIFCTRLLDRLSISENRCCVNPLYFL